MSFGREVRLPVDVMFGESEIRKTGDEYVDDVRRNKENAHHEVRERTKTVTGRLLHYYWKDYLNEILPTMVWSIQSHQKNIRYGVSCSVDWRS